MTSHHISSPLPLCILFHLDIVPIGLGLCIKFQESSLIFRPFCSLLAQYLSVDVITPPLPLLTIRPFLCSNIFQCKAKEKHVNLDFLTVSR